MASKLEQLAQYTQIVADTGDIERIAQLKPQDATTNPSLILAASQSAQYQALINKTLQQVKRQNIPAHDQLRTLVMQLNVAFGIEILQHIPGYVSTEVDPRLSFNLQGTLDYARRIIALYEAKDISRQRVLIKIAATWEGIKAAEQLEQEGIQCNLTLLFSLIQAVASAEAGATLISPFVGRIYDWYCKHTGQDYSANDDPGVLSVSEIYRYFKAHHYQTIIMGASFRNIGQIEALAGCDKLTISPQLLEELEQASGTLNPRLTADGNNEYVSLPHDEANFRWQLNENTMATEQLAQGIRRFARDIEKLEQTLENLS